MPTHTQTIKVYTSFGRDRSLFILYLVSHLWNICEGTYLKPRTAVGRVVVLSCCRRAVVVLSSCRVVVLSRRRVVASSRFRFDVLRAVVLL